MPKCGQATLQIGYTVSLRKEINVPISSSVNMQLFDVTVSSGALALILLNPNMTGATAGFVMLYAREISMSINKVLNTIRSAEIESIGLERTLEYCELEKESDQAWDVDCDLESSNPLSLSIDWPSSGDVEVSNLCARYGEDMPDILHDVSFDVKGGNRIGIVGATGGGKSTLAKAFFNFVDITKGSIQIDGRGMSE